MIAVLAAILATAAPAAPCPSLVTPDALVCLALEAQRKGDDASAAQGFEQAADLAATGRGSADSARLWAAAGNLWIQADQPARAATDLDRALVGSALAGPQRGEALLDRARAAEAQGDLRIARANVFQASGLIANDPFLWYFSAALAIRENDAVAAQAAIARALALAPSDPAILFEAGHVAEFTGDDSLARSYWTRAASADPNGVTGKAATKALELLGVTPSVNNQPQVAR